MKVIIIFASVEGQTRKIARFAEDRLSAAGHDVALFDAADKIASLNLDGADRIILAGCVHERRHPMVFEAFLAAHRLELEACPTLLLSVSLSAAFLEGLEDAEDYVLEMTMRTRFTPSHYALVAGAVRSKKYDYFARQVVHQVVLRGRDYDLNEEEHEFTDWSRLEATLLDFISTRLILAYLRHLKLFQTEPEIRRRRDRFSVSNCCHEDPVPEHLISDRSANPRSMTKGRWNNLP